MYLCNQLLHVHTYVTEPEKTGLNTPIQRLKMRSYFYVQFFRLMYVGTYVHIQSDIYVLECLKHNLKHLKHNTSASTNNVPRALMKSACTIKSIFMPPISHFAFSPNLL